MSWKQLSDQEILQVKFYQAVRVDDQSGLTSLKTVKVPTTQTPKLVKIERGDFSILITTDDKGRISYTEIPFNNVAYIIYEKTPEASKVAKAK